MRKLDSIFGIFITLCIINSCSSVLRSKLKENCLFVEQGDRIGFLKKETFSDIRKKMFQVKSFNFSSDVDTLFTLDFYELESGTTHSRIWGRNDTVNYSYRSRQFQFSGTSFFTSKTCQIVGAWDTSSMASITKSHNNLDTIFAQRIIIEKGDCKFDLFKFKFPIFE